MNHVLSKNKKFFTVLICLLLGIAQMAVAQNIQVRGKVTDEKGEAVIGASVVQKGTSNGIATDANGDFTLSVPGNATLVVSYLGYISKEVRVNNQANLNIEISEDTQALDEVVVTGYGTQKKITVSGSVSTVSNKELTVTKNENVVNMLAGKVPGVRISQRTAQPGEYNTKIDVRGFGEPLFVIDGVARDKDYFSRLDPEEIESINVLKDASAAIYGIRASNGVMLITTKKGTAQNGKVDVSYSGNISLQEMIFIPGGYSEYEWKMLRNEQNSRDFSNTYFTTKNPLHSDKEIEEAKVAKAYDWQKKVFKKLTPQTQHNINLNGGNESLRYYFNLGYMRQDGCYSSGSLWEERVNFRSNVDAKIVNGLSVSISIGGMVNSLHQPAAGLWDNYKAAFLAIPGTPFYANDNPEFLNGYTPWNNEFTNLLGKMDEKYVGKMNRKDSRVNGLFRVNYEIPGIKGLSAYASYDYSFFNRDQNTYKRMYNTYAYNSATQVYTVAKLENGPNSTTSRSANYSRGTDMQVGLSYNNRFGLNSIDVTGVYQETYSYWDDFSASRILKLNSEYLFAGESDGQTGSGGRPGDRSQRAFIGKINYDYDSKYIIGLIARYEANSRWPKDSRWGFFPAASAAWRVSEENFIKNNFEFISNIKLRASYGKMGDEGNAGSYPETFVGYETNNQFGWIFSQGVPTQGIRATAIPNLQKTWIEVTMANIALDFGLFKNKVTGTFEYFMRDRDGIMGDNTAVIPGTVGANLPQINLNKDRFKGWELELGYHGRGKDLTYFITGQVSSTRRMWKYRQETPASHSYDHWRNRYSGRYHNDDFWWSREMLGMFTSIDQIRSFDTYPIGQSSLPGDWWQRDWNNDGIVDDSDQFPYATKGLPWINFGISLGASYKDFDFIANFQGADKVYMRLNEIYTEALPFGMQNGLEWFLDRWHPEDPNADKWNPNTKWISGYYPLTGGDNMRIQSNEIMDAKYIRLKTVELGYNIPKKILSKAKIKNLRIYLNAYNLLTFTPLRDIDPEHQSVEERAGGSDGGADRMYQYPNDKTYTLGLRFTF